MAKKDVAKESENPKRKTFYMQPWFIVLAIVTVIVFWLLATYNSLITLDETVNNKWAQVETQYQRRYDLIPNLVNTVKEYEQFEASLLTELITLRSQWATAATIDEKIGVATQTDSALARLIAVVEAYPDLKTITAISNLMDELAGTENRIAVERMRYNEAVRGYNTAIRVFPTNMVARMFGFIQRAYFEAAEGAATAPTVFPQ